VLKIRNNGIVHEINIPPDKLEVMEKIVNSNVTESVKQNIIKRMSGGLCIICRGIPTHEVIYNVENASRIERYCQDCMKSVYAREQVL
jgi:hypothetical protein